MTNSSRRRRTKPRLLGALAAVAVACGLLAPVAGIAQTASAATVPAAQQYVPTRVPDRVVLTPAADASTAQSVTWRTSTAVTSGQARAEIRVAISEAYRTDITTVPAAENETIDSGFGYQASYHTVRFTGLTPKTTYQYRVGDGTTWSEWQHFSTAAATAEPFSFIYLGDVQNGIKSDASRVIRNAFRDRPDAKMVLQAGDLIDSANDDSQWGEVFEAAGYQFGEQNYLAAAGNHEYEGDTLSRQWQAQFDYPANGPKDAATASVLDGTVHYNDYQGVRFVSLNSNVTESKALAVQTAWLESVLKDNPNTWTVVYFHHPVFSLDEGRNNTAIRQAWVPLFEKYNVDLVLQGHDHNYGRGNTNAAEKDLPAGWNAELNYDGPVYAVSVVGSKMYSNAGPRLWTSNDAHLRKLKGDTELYQLVDVSGGTLRYEARTADGQYYDGLTIVKNAAGKAVTDDSKPDKIDGNTSPCLGCTPNPDPGGTDPGTGNPDQTVDYRVVKQLSGVNKSNAQLPAGSAYSQSKKRLYLGDQNSRSIFELDPETDAVTRSMTLPENIRDLGIDDAKQLLYVGQQNRNWVVVSIADADFGQVVRGPYTFIESNRSIDVDPVAGLVYGAVPSRGVEVLNAETGVSLGVINGTADSYYVAADPKTGMITTAYFEDAEGAINIAAFDPKKDYAQVWEKVTRPNARQLDVDSAHGLVYVGYTGTAAGTGGFSVHRIATGEKVADLADPAYGKDGYGISVDEERQRVFVSNRDFRLNPPGSESSAVAVTISQRNGVAPTNPGTDPGTDPGTGTPPTGTGYTPTALKAVPSATDNADLDVKPVGSVVDPVSGHLFVGNEMRPARVLEIDPATDRLVATHAIPGGEGEGIRDVAIDSAKGELYVAYGAAWAVLDLKNDTVKRGPFAFAANVRGLDVDLTTGRVFGATRQTGFQVMDATTGAAIATVDTAGAANWTSHGIAVDPVANRLYVSNDNAAGTEGVRVYDATTYAPLQTLAVAKPDYRSLAVDPAAGRLYIGHSTDTFEASGVRVLKTADLSEIANFSAHAFGNKVYGVSVDSAKGVVYVSARDRYPAAVIALQRAK